MGNPSIQQPCSYFPRFACELALHRRDDLRHGLGRSSGGRDDVARPGAATAPVLLGGAIHGGLGGSHGVAGGHQAALDAKLLLQHSHSRSKAIGGAGGAGHALHGGVVGVLIHAHHNGVRVILGGGREDHLLCASLQVTLNLVRGQEHSRGLAHVLGAMLTEGDFCRVAGVGQRNLLAVHHQGISVHLHGAVILAMDSVILPFGLSTFTLTTAATKQQRLK